MTTSVPFSVPHPIFTNLSETDLVHLSDECTEFRMMMFGEYAQAGLGRCVDVVAARVGSREVN